MVRVILALLAGIYGAGITSIAVAQIVGPVHVMDGDTLRINGSVIRLHGIDAPETDQTCTDTQSARWNCGVWVTTQVREMYQGRSAICEPQSRDRYGRLVARCFVQGQDIGQRLVSDGLAFAYRRYSMAYDLDEKGAAVNNRGLHASQVQNPSQFRKSKVKGATPLDAGCAIKGNISKSGHIYHLPGQRDYDRTGINSGKGEKWFCSEQEARRAGWRKAKR